MLGLATSCLLLAVVKATHIPTSEDLHTSKVFVMAIEPGFFNWTDSKSSYVGNQFSYRPSLLNAPDLPSWMFYTYSKRHNKGFVYGAPPLQQKDLQIEVIGLNRNNYEARRRVINMTVLENKEPALYEVHLKVDKLNVEDILESCRYKDLLNVFRHTLWPESQEDLYVTFIASAVHLGARLPLKPTEGEGVVIHIGSRAPFSQSLLNLQKEVGPLRSKGLTNCPDFKHTSEERFFKQYNFSLDWCAFSLSVKQLAKEKTQHRDVTAGSDSTRQWQPISKQELPTRNYLSELAVTLIVPLFCFIVVVALLTFILCFQQDTVIQNASEAIINSISVMFEGLLSKRNDDTPQSLLVQYEAVHRASNTLRSLSTQRDTSPRLSVERGGLRPNPPPYTGVQHSSREEYLDDDDAKTWYC